VARAVLMGGKIADLATQRAELARTLWKIHKGQRDTRASLGSSACLSDWPVSIGAGFMKERKPQLALFIDADNVNLQIAPDILNRLSVHWDVCYRRAYGLNLLTDQETLREQSVVPVEVLQNSRGKNATDFALVIDAMEELCEGHFEAICIVSADGDFTRLVQRIREKGITAIVFGKSAAAATLRKACSEFHAIEGLPNASNRLEMKLAPKKQAPSAPKKPVPVVPKKAVPDVPKKPTPPAPKKPAPPAPKAPSAEAREMVRKGLHKVFLKLSTSNEIVTLEQFGKSLHENHPNLAPAMFGRRRLKPFLEQFGGFEVVPLPQNDGRPPVDRVKLPFTQANRNSTEMSLHLLTASRS
jgi:hypothetical protein